MIIVQRSVQGTVVLRSPAELPLSSWRGHKKTWRWIKIGRWWWCHDGAGNTWRWGWEWKQKKITSFAERNCVYGLMELSIQMHLIGSATLVPLFLWFQPCIWRKKPSASASEEIGILNLRLWMIFAGLQAFVDFHIRPWTRFASGWLFFPPCRMTMMIDSICVLLRSSGKYCSKYSNVHEYEYSQWFSTMWWADDDD